jgi:hypothetical protein
MMSGQDQTTANKPAEPVLCKMGCGFFVSITDLTRLRDKPIFLFCWKKNSTDPMRYATTTTYCPLVKYFVGGLSFKQPIGGYIMIERALFLVHGCSARGFAFIGFR